MKPRVYMFRPADYVAPPRCVVSDRLHSLGVYELAMLRWAEAFGGDFDRAWRSSVDERRLPALLPLAMARGVSCPELGAIGAQLLSRVVAELGVVVPPFVPTWEQPPRRSSRIEPGALIATPRTSTSTGGVFEGIGEAIGRAARRSGTRERLAELEEELLAARFTLDRDYHVAQAAARVAHLAGRHAVVGAAAHAEELGEHLGLAIAAGLGELAGRLLVRVLVDAIDAAHPLAAAEVGTSAGHSDCAT